jgi:hypothetical protein
VSVAGVAASQEASDIAAAIGSVSVSGAAAIAEQSDTVAASGAESVSGVAAVTESPDSVTASGTTNFGVSGIAAIQEQPDIAAGEGISFTPSPYYVATMPAPVSAILEAQSDAIFSALNLEAESMQPQLTATQSVPQFTAYWEP